ncbi:MAG: hypothetical protein AAFO94_03805, partial [Bacteroidota bacterium]
VNVRWDGAGAEDVDAGIVQVLEPGLLAVEGVESTESRYQQLSFNNSKSPEVSSLRRVVNRSNLLGGIAALVAQTCLLIGIINAISAAG